MFISSATLAWLLCIGEQIQFGFARLWLEQATYLLISLCLSFLLKIYGSGGGRGINSGDAQLGLAKMDEHERIGLFRCVRG